MPDMYDKEGNRTLMSVFDKPFKCNYNVIT
jgi:hypothetical protein